MLSDEQKVYDLVKAYIEKHGICCEEDVYQSDRVIVNAYDLIADLCAVVGYAKYEEEE